MSEAGGPRSSEEGDLAHAGKSAREGRSCLESLQRPGAGYFNCAMRIWLPDGSRKPASMP
jgi:hypothetical protein